MNDGTGLRFSRLGWPVSNAWLLDGLPDGPVLVDTGHASLWLAIRAGLRRCGMRPGDLAAVLLTHRHSDHAGNAARLASRHGVPVYAHPEDGAVLAGLGPRPRLPLRGVSITSAFCAAENLRPAPPCRTRPLFHGDRVAGLEAIWAPGHTAGSVLLWHEASGTLFSGDTLLNAVPPLTWRTGVLCLAWPAYCEDHARALGSVRSLLDLGLPIRALCPGHGPRREGPLLEEIRELMRDR